MVKFKMIFLKIKTHSKGNSLIQTKCHCYKPIQFIEHYILLTVFFSNVQTFQLIRVIQQQHKMKLDRQHLKLMQTN